MGLLKSIRRKIYSRTSRYLSNAMLVEGTLKETDIRLKALFVDNTAFTEYIILRTYAGPPVVLKKWKILNSSLEKVITGLSDSLDICIAVLPVEYDSSLKGAYSFKCQEYVRQIIDTTGSWEDVRARFCKKKRQITKDFETRYGLGYRISNDLKDFDFFYHRMHVPHIRKQFGNLSDIDSYDEMKKYYLKGFLLFVTRDNEDIAGALCLVEDGAIAFRRTGVLDGDESNVKTGAQTALYYFQLVYANEHDIHAVDTMKSRPFLNDGVYRHKRDWGAEVLPDNESGTWVYFFNTGPDEKIARFFENNPAIVNSDKGLKGVIGVSDRTETSTASINNLNHKYQSPGINEFIVLTPNGKIPDGKELNDSQIN